MYCSTMDSGEIIVKEDNTLSPKLRDSVFKNELIRDRIFDYVFTSDNENKRTYGLVEHSWLEYVTDRLRNTPKCYPEWISFYDWGKLEEDLVSKPKGFQVHKFLDTWASDAYPDAGTRVPLFHLSFHPPHHVAITRYEVQDLIKCLMRCGNGLTSLKLELMGDIDYGLNDALSRMDFVADLEHLDFPYLKQLDIKVCPPNKDNHLSTLLLPPIFLGCKRLTQLHLKDDLYHYPKNYAVSRLASEGRSRKDAYLPNTLEKIEIKALLTSQLLSDLLLKNSLPNLTQLKLKICKKAYRKGVVSSILDRLSRQLKSFTVQNISEASGNESTFVKFPVMTKLKKMSVIGFHSELESGMEQCFPVLETLELNWQSSPMMEKWTENFQFNCVIELHVTLSYEEDIDVNFTLELSKQVYESFPRLQILDLTIEGQVRDGSIRTIFQHMTQLRELSIFIWTDAETIGASNIPPFYFEATILGVSPEYAKYLAESPRELWNSINLDNVRSPSHSIVNLAELTKFSLFVSASYNRNDLRISDVSFHFAFLRMPNLKKLDLRGNNVVSKAMWLELERKINSV